MNAIERKAVQRLIKATKRLISAEEDVSRDMGYKGIVGKGVGDRHQKALDAYEDALSAVVTLMSGMDEVS